jgi:hypothetical protein
MSARAGQHDLVNRPVSAPVLRGHQLCGNRKRCRDGKASGKTGEQADDDQLLAALHQRDQQGEEIGGGHTDQHDGPAAPVVRYRRSNEPADTDHQGTTACS